MYADEGIRVCTQCSGQLAYIEEGIEDDELDRFTFFLRVAQTHNGLYFLCVIWFNESLASVVHADFVVHL